MGLFKKNKPTQQPEMFAQPISNNSPLDMAMSLKNQGYSNNQIIQTLQSQGFNSQQIFDTINMMQPGNIPAGPINQQGDIPGNMQMPQNFPQNEQEMPEQGFVPENQEQSIEPPHKEFHHINSGFDESKEKIEEMAEAIIDEKWEELVKTINKIIEWKEKVETNLNKIEQEIVDIKEGFSQLHSSVIGKISEYDKNIVNVGTEVKAMEKVFEKILPTFTENVSELKRMVKGNKK